MHVQIAEILSHFFTFLILLARVNSKTVWCLKNSLDMNTFKFSWNLSSQLTKPFNENCQINGIGTVVIDKMEKVLDSSLHEERPPGGIGKRYSFLGEIKRWCKNCEVRGTKTVKNNLTKSKEQGGVCGTIVCRHHSTRICCDFIEQWTPPDLFNLKLFVLQLKRCYQNVIPVPNSEGFMLCKKIVHNGANLNVYPLFDF